MTSVAGPIYEVTLETERDLAGEFDAWLEQHVEEMLGLPGFVDANVFEAVMEDPARIGRVVHYVLESDQALEDYLAGPAEAMRRSGLVLFGDRLRATRRVLHTVPALAAPVARSCLNCAMPLQGQYCARCGQRARGRLISIWELVRDAVGDLFELDSRLWRTVIPLVFRPGKLTHEYLIGRRARFMPPFRTYLVLSVIFFLVAFFDPQQQLGILYEPLPPEPAADTVPEEAGPDEAEPERENRRGLNIQVSPDGSPDVNCDLSDFDLSGPDWLTRRLTRERLEQVCNRITADRGQSFLNQLLDNLPAALFVLLPLMALVLKMLYPLSKRYYAEHLLFVLHFHAFLFLILTLEIVFSRLAAWVGMPGIVSNLSVFIVSLYVPLYLYLGLRRVYRQGRTITILKYFLLVMTYLIGLALILLFAAFYTAFSI